MKHLVTLPPIQEQFQNILVRTQVDTNNTSDLIIPLLTVTPTSNGNNDDVPVFDTFDDIEDAEPEQTPCIYLTLQHGEPLQVSLQPPTIDSITPEIQSADEFIKRTIQNLRTADEVVKAAQKQQASKILVPESSTDTSVETTDDDEIKEVHFKHEDNDKTKLQRMEREMKRLRKRNANYARTTRKIHLSYKEKELVLKVKIATLVEKNYEQKVQVAILQDISFRYMEQLQLLREEIRKLLPSQN